MENKLLDADIELQEQVQNETENPTIETDDENQYSTPSR